jgi:rRNA maturation RNase YbeY
MISINVDSQSTIKIPYNKTIIRSLLETVFSSEDNLEVDVNLIFCDDEFLSDLKKQFFNVSQWTDVIAFRLNDYSESKIEGEIYISLPRIKENAKTFKEPIKKELARVIIHGGLHLVGYGDTTDDEKQSMREKENQYLDQTEWNKL